MDSARTIKVRLIVDYLFFDYSHLLSMTISVLITFIQYFIFSVTLTLFLIHFYPFTNSLYYFIFPLISTYSLSGLQRADPE